ncbi:MAG: hypothetical protein WDZ30_07565 [Cellvibrionaceae bacterium]
MAKAKSPIRLQQDTMSAAEREAKLYNRTQAQQLEYWIKLGRKVADVADAKTLLDVQAGFATLSVQPVAVPDVNPDDIFAELGRAATAKERKRGGAQGATTGLADSMADHASIRYQASPAHPGLLERIDSKTGHTDLGYFLNGEFIPYNDGDGKRVADLGQ